MFVNLDYNEIERMHSHMKNKYDYNSDFKVCKWKDIEIMFCFRNNVDNTINNIYNILFKTKNVDIIKHFTNDSIDFDLNSYEEIVYEEIDDLYTIIPNTNLLKKFESSSKLIEYVCKIYFYLYDNNI